jgi:hypothetical protein
MKSKIGLLILILGLLAVPVSAMGQAKIIITMGPMGGTMYPVGAAIAEMITKNIPGTTATVTVGGSITNIELVHKGERQMGHTTAELVRAATTGGIDPFQQPRNNIRALAKLQTMYFQMGILNSVGIKSLAEVKEKKFPLRVCTNPRGNMVELVLQRVLKEYGITYEDIKGWGGKVHFVSHSDSVSLVRDGHADAATMFTSVPAPAFTEISLTRPLSIVSLKEDIVSKLCSQYGYARGIVPAGTYKGQDKDALTLSAGIILVVNSKLSDDLIYQIAKLMNSEDGRRKIGAIHADIAKEFTPDKAFKDLGGPLHPGAEKYYREIGVLK